MSRPTGIPVRRPDADLAHAEVGRWLVPDDPVLSHLMAALSGVFPNGEDFFVDSVRNYRDRFADDPEMKAKIKGFIGQESMHGREHRALNERLAGMGYPTPRYDADLQKAADRMRRRLPKALQLAVTAASEHFTSVLAHAVLSDEQTRRTLFPDADMQLLITWHALEELEHKDVAFDVLQSVSRSYWLRMLGGLMAMIGWGPTVARGMARALADDRRHIGLRAWRRAWRDYWRQQMVGPRALLATAGYIRPGFHPRDVDTDALVLEWRDRLEPQLLTPRAAAS